jgi:hypothetical protein
MDEICFSEATISKFNYEDLPLARAGSMPE